MDKGVDRTRIGGVLSVISVQAPSVHGNTSGHLFCIAQHVVNRPDASKRSRWVVFKGVHDQIGSGCDAASVRITRPVSEHGHSDVGAVTAVAIGGRRIQPKLRVR